MQFLVTQNVGEVKEGGTVIGVQVICQGEPVLIPSPKAIQLHRAALSRRGPKQSPVTRRLFYRRLPALAPGASVAAPRNDIYAIVRCARSPSPVGAGEVGGECSNYGYAQPTLIVSGPFQDCPGSHAAV
jgi:hypothetical protein